MKQQLGGLFYSPDELRAFRKNQEGLADYREFKCEMKKEQSSITESSPMRARTRGTATAQAQTKAAPQTALPLTPLPTAATAHRAPTQTKAELETAKRLRERNERERGRRIQKIHLEVKNGGSRVRRTQASNP